MGRPLEDSTYVVLKCKSLQICKRSGPGLEAWAWNHYAVFFQFVVVIVVVVFQFLT